MYKYVARWENIKLVVSQKVIDTCETLTMYVTHKSASVHNQSLFKIYMYIVCKIDNFSWWILRH